MKLSKEDKRMNENMKKLLMLAISILIVLAFSLILEQLRAGL